MFFLVGNFIDILRSYKDLLVFGGIFFKLFICMSIVFFVYNFIFNYEEFYEGF